MRFILVVTIQSELVGLAYLIRSQIELWLQLATTLVIDIIETKLIVHYQTVNSSCRNCPLL